MVFLFLQGLNLSLWLGANRPCSLETISCILSIRCVFCIEYFRMVGWNRKMISGFFTRSSIKLFLLKGAREERDHERGGGWY